MCDFAMMLKTYSGDLEHVKRLVKSFLKYNCEEILLFIIVPQEDYNVFKQIFFKYPLIVLINENSDFEKYLTTTSIEGLSPGYINQAIIKLAFWESKLCMNYFCLDSDVYFIKDFYIKDFMYDKGIPYTVLTEDKDLKTNPYYYMNYWKAREERIKQIQSLFKMNESHLYTCHNCQIFSSIVLKSLHDEFMIPNHYSYLDLISISPYEFSWYNLWIQKSKVIQIRPCEPLIKIYHTVYDHIFSIMAGIGINDLKRSYLGVCINSNYSKIYGVIDYEDSEKYFCSCNVSMKILIYMQSFILWCIINKVKHKLIKIKKFFLQTDQRR